MARFQKLRTIYRVLFPKKRTDAEIFEARLRRIPHISSFEKASAGYEVTTAAGNRALIRDQRFSDRLVFEQIFSLGEYAIVLSMLRYNNGSDSAVIIDAGANVGYTSLFFCENLENPTIFAVEPSAENGAVFQKNTSAFQNVKLYPNALSASDDESFSLDRSFRDGQDWSIVTEPDASGEIQGISVSGIIRENNLNQVDLLKIDIEGAERFIFKAGVDLSFLDKVKIICLEIHDEFDIRNSICDLLRTHGFYLLESGETTIGIQKKFLR